jgi:WD40 repeat protein
MREKEFSEKAQAEDGSPELPTEPILRIETGKHGALIHRIDTDAGNRFAVTASDDKTARVWSLPEGRLMRVLRLPIDQGDIGKAYAVAISPDGTTVAVGGLTGPAGHHNIFLFDRASGELRRRLAGFPNIINHLAYSPDGRRLAASLGGRMAFAYSMLATTIGRCRAIRNTAVPAIRRQPIARDAWSRRHTTGLSGCTKPTAMRRRSPVLGSPDTGPI